MQLKERFAGPSGGIGSDSQQSNAESAGRALEYAQKLSRAGRGADASQAFWKASKEFELSRQPLAAIAAALEAAWIGRGSPDPMAEVAEVAGRAEGDSVLSSLQSPNRRALARILHPIHFGADAVIAREGLPIDSIWFVVRGCVLATTRGMRGSRVRAGRFEEGAIVSESGALRGARRQATLMAEQPADLLELRIDEFAPLLVEHPALSILLETR